MSLTTLLAACECGQTVGSGEIRDAEVILSCKFPPDYVEFLREFGRAEGPVGADGYIMLYPLSEVIDANADTQEYRLSGFVLLGSNGGGEAFGFRVAADGCQYIAVPWVTMAEEDTVMLGETLIEALTSFCGDWI